MCHARSVFRCSTGNRSGESVDDTVSSPRLRCSSSSRPSGRSGVTTLSLMFRRLVKQQIQPLFGALLFRFLIWPISAGSPKAKARKRRPLRFHAGPGLSLRSGIPESNFRSWLKWWTRRRQTRTRQMKRRRCSNLYCCGWVLVKEKLFVYHSPAIYYIILHYITLYYIILYYIILYYIKYCIILYYVIYYIILYIKY